MFRTLLTADLPSVERPGAAPGDDDFARSHDRVSFGSAHLLELLRRTFGSADVLDIAFVRIDDDLVYADTQRTSQDEVDDLLERAAEAGFLARPFFRIIMSLDHTEDGIRHAIEVNLSTAVPAGEPELQVVISSRPLSCLPEPNEEADVYAARVRASAAQEATWAADRAHVGSLRDRLHAALKDALQGSTVTAGEVELRVVRPDMDDLRALNRLALGPGYPGVVYSLAPDGRAPGWPDPALSQYDDPTIVLRHLMMLEAIMQDGHLRLPWVHVADPGGKLLFDGTKARWFEQWPWRKKFDVVAAHGRVAVIEADSGGKKTFLLD